MKLIASSAKNIYEIASIAAEHHVGEYEFKAFCNEIRKRASTEADKDTANKIKGDLLEIFANFFFAAFKNEPRIGLVNYEPIDIEDDYGVDGVGTNAAGNKVAVQVKYRSNREDKITYGDIAKTYSAGQRLLDLDLSKKEPLYMFLPIAKELIITAREFLENLYE